MSGGEQALTATAGSVTVEAGAISAGAITAIGGDVDLSAFQDIGTGAISASGAITVESNAADGNLTLGALTAGLFLQEFVGDSPWAHLDLGLTASVEADDGVNVKGATGVGVRLLAEVAAAWGK